jgi:NADPH-dependent curcumin reductase CurA
MNFFSLGIYMTQTTDINRQMTLASRPFGAPTAENFALVHTAKPIPKADEVLLRTVFLSLDPYMRGRMNDAKFCTDYLGYQLT